MPELPEVETTRLGITPKILNQIVSAVKVRQPKLRWPVPESLSLELPGLCFHSIERRGKYLLLETTKGVLLVHLGMSGSLRIVPSDNPPTKHDHVDVMFNSGFTLRYTDPRRFGCMLWIKQPVYSHPLLKNLGLEPLSDEFDGRYLKLRSLGKQTAIKSFIMDSSVVVGVGNIYANESLFNAGISPTRKAKNISLSRFQLLAEQIKLVLKNAIKVGGTTLRDFTGSDGKPGYFKQSLMVYGRGGEPCFICNRKLTELRIGQRSTVYCIRCQS